MQREKVRTAIVGCGKVAHLHAEALKTLPASEFVAVCGGSHPEWRNAFAERYGVKAYATIDDLLAAGVADMITIATPHPAHADAATKAARAGLHVLVEKPLASSLEDCDAILAAARDGGGVLGMICQRRFFAPCQRIRRAIDDGKLGRPILGAVTMLGWRDEAYYRSDPWRGSWRGEGGGVLVNQAPHQLDLLLWYMGEIDELFGYWANLNHPTIEVEDTAVAGVRFKNGALGNIVVSNSQNPALYGKVTVHGNNGASVGVQTDGGAMFIAGMSNITEPPLNDLWSIPGEENLLARWRQEDTAYFNSINAVEYYHRLQIDDFLHAILDQRPPLITGEDGRRTVELFTAIYRANRDRRAIRFPLVAESGRDDFDGRRPRHLSGREIEAAAGTI
ncbi:MAG TPA: Gfo/Idh/MocA family oxidoreductase [Verrucomicrobiae bacterium]|nr:Gfo/Idh/MocA family oxidoreductase [Verrucomicrobiae bacterium]